MKRGIALMTVVLSAACSGGQSSGGPTATGADSAAIAALEGRLQVAALAANWDAWGSEYTADPVRFPPNAAPLVGKAAADAFNHASPHFSRFTVALTAVVVRNDLAVATGTYTAAAPPGKDAAGKATPAMNEEGKWMQILMKQADGTWKISKDIWNSDVPAPVAPSAPPK